MNNIIQLVVFFVLLIAVIVIYYYICICSKNSYKIGSDEIYGSGIFSYFNRSTKIKPETVTPVVRLGTTENPYKLAAEIITLKKELKELDNENMRGPQWEIARAEITNKLFEKEYIVKQITESNIQEYTKKIR